MGYGWCLSQSFGLAFILWVKFLGGHPSEIPQFIRGLNVQEKNACVVPEDLLIASIYKNKVNLI